MCFSSIFFVCVSANLLISSNVKKKLCKSKINKQGRTFLLIKTLKITQSMSARLNRALLMKSGDLEKDISSMCLFLTFQHKCRDVLLLLRSCQCNISPTKPRKKRTYELYNEMQVKRRDKTETFSLRKHNKWHLLLSNTNRKL